MCLGLSRAADLLLGTCRAWFAWFPVGWPTAQPSRASSAARARTRRRQPRDRKPPRLPRWSPCSFRGRGGARARPARRARPLRPRPAVLARLVLARPKPHQGTHSPHSPHQGPHRRHRAHRKRGLAHWHIPEPRSPPSPAGFGGSEARSTGRAQRNAPLAALMSRSQRIRAARLRSPQRGGPPVAQSARWL